MVSFPTFSVCIHSFSSSVVQTPRRRPKPVCFSPLVLLTTFYLSFQGTVMSPSRAFTLTLLYLSLLVAFVNAHDVLQQRGLHDYNMKRAMMRKRAPMPQISGGPVTPLPDGSVVGTSTKGDSDPQSTTTTSTSTSLPPSVSIVIHLFVNTFDTLFRLRLR